MAIIIVTTHCYLVCQAINYITIQDIREEDAKRLFGSRHHRSKRRRSKLISSNVPDTLRYTICIDFVPLSTASQTPSPLMANKNSSDDRTRQVEIAITGLNNCISLFRTIVTQIREQMPDQLYLDKLVDTFLRSEVE